MGWDLEWNGNECKSCKTELSLGEMVCYKLATRDEELKIFRAGLNERLKDVNTGNRYSDDHRFSFKYSPGQGHSAGWICEVDLNYGIGSVQLRSFSIETEDHRSPSLSGESFIKKKTPLAEDSATLVNKIVSTLDSEYTRLEVPEVYSFKIPSSFNDLDYIDLTGKWSMERDGGAVPLELDLKFSIMPTKMVLEIKDQVHTSQLKDLIDTIESVFLKE